MKLNDEVYEQIKSACREMRQQAQCIPNAPSGFFGYITEDVESLDLEALADKYARDWWEREESGQHPVGTCDISTRRAVIYAIEAVLASSTSEDLKGDVMETLRQSAIVAHFAKGWGFAELETTRSAIFIHHSDIIGRTILHEGDRIVCTVEPSGHPRNPFRGRNIELIQPASKAVRS
jgi:cold shock CspA family protein